MDILNYTACCGVKEINSIQSRKPDEVLRLIGKDSYGPEGTERLCKYAFLSFTANDGELGKKSYGHTLKKYIEKAGLGDVVASVGKVNPNTGRTIVHYLWNVNDDALRAWFKEDLKVRRAEISKMLSPFKVGQKIRLRMGESWEDTPAVSGVLFFKLTDRIEDESVMTKMNGGAWSSWWIRLDELKKFELYKTVKNKV